MATSLGFELEGGLKRLPNHQKVLPRARSRQMVHMAHCKEHASKQ